MIRTQMKSVQTSKLSLSPPPGEYPRLGSQKSPERPISPASASLWTRYVDSRLKQFGTTR